MKHFITGVGVGMVGNALYDVVRAALQSGSGPFMHALTKESVERDQRMRAAANALRNGIDPDSIDAAAVQIEALSFSDQQKVLSKLVERIGA